MVGTRGRTPRAIVLYVGLTIAAVIVLFPFFWMVVTAFKQPGQAFTPSVFPANPTLENFARILKDYGFARYFVNSVIVATVAATFATLFAAQAIAGVGAGVYKTIQEAVDETVVTGDTTVPRMDNASKYEKNYQLYKSLYNSLKDDFRNSFYLYTSSEEL